MAEHTVDEIMNRTICALPSDATVERAAGFMRAAGPDGQRGGQRGAALHRKVRW